MTQSASTFMAILFGLGVFAIIVAVGWRSVQNRRMLRLQGADGQETIILADEDDDISSVVTTTTDTSQPAPSSAAAVDPSKTLEVDADVLGRDRPSRVVSSAN